MAGFAGDRSRGHHLQFDDGKLESSTADSAGDERTSCVPRAFGYC